MSKGNKKKTLQLGIPFGTACNRLRRSIMFALLRQTDKDTCHRCGEVIESVDNLSIEHVRPWMDSEDPKGLFWDLNILRSAT